MEGLHWSKILAVLINFGLLYLVLKHFFFKTINGAIDKRQSDIVEKISKTDEDMKKAEVLRIQNEKNVADSKQQGKTIVEGYKQKAENLSTEIIEEARKESDTIIQRARVEAERVKAKTADEIKSQAIELAVLLSTKALGENVNEDQHRKLIRDFIVKVGN